MATAQPGWMGRQRQVLHFLRVVGADTDDEGNFLIAGAPVASFMGVGGENADVVVPAETVYYCQGRAAGLAAGLAGTSYGLSITVI